MKTVMDVILAVSDADLKLAMHELKTLRDIAVLPAGIVRQVAAALTGCGISESDSLKLAKVELIEAAAFKWAGIALTA